MKRVLIIAYQFPPMGGSGVQRTSKFVKYLRDFGYEPVVLTRDEKNIGLSDATLLKDIPTDITIYKTNSYDFSEGSGVFSIPGKVLGRKILIPDSARLWEMALHSKVIEIIKKENIKLIYSTSYPYSDHLLGLFIKKSMGDSIKWVVDFRDEWANNPYTLDNPHNAIRTKIEKQMEKDVLNNCDAIVANTPVMKSNFIKNNQLSTEKINNFYVIPNGYDKEDFEMLDTSKKENDKFTISYTGALYGRRKPNYFFSAIQILGKEGQIDINKLQINFIGNYNKAQLTANVTQYGLESAVTIYDYMPHQEAIQILLNSDALLLLEGGGIGSDAFYTGKIFEYMNTNRQVLAVLPTGCAMDLVIDTNIGLVSKYDDVEATKRNVLEMFNNWVNKINNYNPDYTKIKEYDRIALTGKLSEVFDSL